MHKLCFITENRAPHIARGEEQTWFPCNLMEQYRGCDVTGSSEETNTVSKTHTFIETGDTKQHFWATVAGERFACVCGGGGAATNPSPVALQCSSRPQDPRQGPEGPQHVGLSKTRNRCWFRLKNHLRCVQALRSLRLCHALWMNEHTEAQVCLDFSKNQVLEIKSCQSFKTYLTHDMEHFQICFVIPSRCLHLRWPVENACTWDDKRGTLLDEIPALCFPELAGSAS